MARKMEKVFIPLPMEINMMDNGKMDKNVEMVNLFL